MALCIATSLVAQDYRPSWIETPPQNDSTYRGIVKVVKPLDLDSLSVEIYKQKGRSDALWEVFTQMPWNIEQEHSLYASLLRERLYNTSLYGILSGEMEKSSFFMFEEWEDGNEYWCHASVTMQDAEEFIEQLIYRSKNSGYRLYNEARRLQANGCIYRAARKYVEALDSIHPAIFRFLPILKDSVCVDLGREIYNGYLNVYKNVVMTSETKDIVAIYGKGVPMDFSFLVTQDGVPLPNLEIMSKFEGLVNVSPSTDVNGECRFSIGRITSEEKNQHLEFMIDAEALTDLPPVYGCNAIKNEISFPSFEIPIHLEEPQTLVLINTQDTLLKQRIEQIWMSNRADVKFTEHPDLADIVVNVDLNIEKEKYITTEYYRLAQYNTSLHIKANEIVDNKPILEYEIKDLKIVLPASRNDEHTQQTVKHEVIRQLEREFPDYVKEYKFDIRKIIWNSLNPAKDQA